MDSTCTIQVPSFICPQNGLTALKLVQSRIQTEAHQEICDILMQYTQQGSKVIHPEQEESELRQEEKTKAGLAEVSMDNSWR